MERHIELLECQFVRRLALTIQCARYLDLIGVHEQLAIEPRKSVSLISGCPKPGRIGDRTEQRNNSNRVGGFLDDNNQQFGIDN
jgi:hypothetical protein